MVKELLYWLATMAALLVKCSYFQHTSEFLDKPFPSATGIVVMIMTMSLLAIAMVFIFLLFKRKRLTVLFVFNLLVTIMLIADTNFYRYYQGVITLPVILNLDLRLVGSVNESIISLFRIYDIIYLVDLPFMFFWMKKVNKAGIEILPFRRRLSISAFALALSIAGVLGIHRNVHIGPFPYSNNYITQQFGVLYTHLDTTKDYFEDLILNDETLTAEDIGEINKFFSEKNKAAKKKSKAYQGIARGKNLIMIQVEALQEFVIGRNVNGYEITPNINKLIGESIYFDNIYCQTAGGNTSDAELLVNTSLYPAPEGAANYLYPDNFYYTLARALEEKGYNTYAMHGFKPEFYNRNIIYKNYGYDRFFSEEDYILDEFAGWETEALSDSSFFRQSLEKITGKDPFFSFLVTLSSHHPFKYFEDYKFDEDGFNVGKWQGTYLGNYLKAAHYADKCIGEFITALKNNGLYDNSVIVLYGDHTAIPRYLAEELMEFLDMELDEYNLMKVKKVPLVIHYKGLGKSRTVSITGGQIDIMPTVANIMGVNVPYAIGKDLFNTNKGYAIFRNGSVVTDDYLYISDLGRMFDNEGNDLDLSLYVEELEKFQQELRISDLIIENNAFKIKNKF